MLYTSVAARGEAMNQVTFDLLDVRGRGQPQMWEQTSDGGAFPRWCELPRLLSHYVMI